MKLRFLVFLLTIGLFVSSGVGWAEAATSTDPNFKVAFIGDSGAGSNFQAVLNLIKAEGAQMVLHQGDFDYSDGPQKWMDMINNTLGASYPYLGSDGNHDNWDADGYATFFKNRLQTMGITAPATVAPSYGAVYKGLKMVFVKEGGDPAFIDSQLGGDDHTWKICSWHKNQNYMQVGGKGNEQGWPSYDTCAKYGAVIATAHEHSYERTKTLLGGLSGQTLANLQVDFGQHPVAGGIPGNPNSVLVAPGKSFVFVSGLGGNSIRNQDRCLPTTYPFGSGTGCNYIWANVYTSDQGAKYGALFITFNVDGNPNKARGYFKNISGQTIDQFEILASSQPGPTSIPGPSPTVQPTSVPTQSVVLPTVETGAAHTSGDNADDSAIWIHPTDPSQSVVIGDDKGGGMMVWNLDGSETQFIDGSKLMNNVDIRYNFPLAGSFATGGSHSRVALVVVGHENGNALAFYKVNPGTRKLEPAGQFGLSISAPYGGCMYLSPVTGKYYYFINWKSGVWQQVELRDGGGGNVTGTVVRSHDAGGQPEGCTADDVHKLYYLGEEAVGVWRYGAEPGDGTTRVQMDKTGTGGNLTADVEGLALYYRSDGGGYLIVSSQGNSTFQVYQRKLDAAGKNVFVGSFKVGANGTIDASTGTDGLDVTNFPLGSGFSSGMFVNHDQSNTGGSASNHKLTPFGRIASELGLTMDTGWDPRQVGGGGTIPTPVPTQTPTSGPSKTPTPVAPTTPPGGCGCNLLGDANCDGAVDEKDYAVWVAQYGTQPTACPNNADFDDDGTVDGVDYVMWLNNYGKTSTTPTVAPPVTPGPTVGLTPAPTQPPSGGNIIHKGTVTGGSSNSAVVSTATGVTGVTGDAYLASISTKPNKAVTSVSGLGLTWVRVAAQCSGANQTRVEVWQGQGTVSGSGVVVANLEAAPLNAVIAVSRYGGNSLGIGSVVTANSNGVSGACSGTTNTASYSVTLPAGANSLAFGAAAIRLRTHTPGSGFTEEAEVHQGSSGDVAGLGIEDKAVATGGNVSVSGSLSSTTDWAVAAVEVKSGSSTTPPGGSLIKNMTFEGGNLVDPVTGADSMTGTVVLDSTAPIKGAYSARFPNVGASYLREAVTGTPDIYVTFYLRLNAPRPDSERIVYITNAGTVVGVLVVQTNGKLYLRNASTAIGLPATLSEGTVYRVGLHQKTGSGANGILEGYMAVGDAPFGEPFAANNTQTFTTAADYVSVGPTSGSNPADFTVDDIRISTGGI